MVNEALRRRVQAWIDGDRIRLIEQSLSEPLSGVMNPSWLSVLPGASALAPPGCAARSALVLTR